MFSENWDRHGSKYCEEIAIRNKTLFGMFYYVDVEQYAGRFCNLPINPGCGSPGDIGIEHIRQETSYNHFGDLSQPALFGFWYH
jgi:hypothetical protein